MQLTVLGCAGSFPGPDGACSAYLVEHDGFRLMVDLGNGALSAMQRACGLYGVDAVVITHLHSDHCIDLVPWAVAWRYGAHGLDRVPVLGPADTQRRIAEAYLCVEGDQLDDVFDFQVLTAGTRTLGPFTVTAAVMNHPVETYGLRISAGGRTLAYSSDTAPCAALDTLADGVDLLLAEASFLTGDDNPAGIHLTGEDAGRTATEAGVGQLLLTHLVPWHDPETVFEQARLAFRGRLQLAAPGQVHRV